MLLPVNAVVALGAFWLFEGVTTGAWCPDECAVILRLLKLILVGCRRISRRS